MNKITFVFDPAGTSLPSDEQLIPFTSADSAPVVARSIRDAINSAAAAGKFKVTAELSDWLITGSTSPFGVLDTNTSVDLINAVSIGGKHTCPFGGEQSRRSAADAAGRSSNQSNLVFKSSSDQWHRVR